MSFLEVSPYAVSRRADDVRDVFTKMHATLQQIENEVASVPGFHRGAHCAAYIAAGARFSDAAQRMHLLLNQAGEALSHTSTAYHSQDDAAKDNISSIGL